MKITNEIDETMNTVQHRKVYSIHFGLPDSQLSDQLMKAVSMQILHEDMGMPISIAWRMHYIPRLPCKLPLYYFVLDMLMFSIDVHITENNHGLIHTIFLVESRNSSRCK